MPNVISHDNKNTRILNSMDEAISCGVGLLQNVKEKIDLLVDVNGPAFIIKFDSYKDNYNKARSRGVKVRCVTEVTKDNIRHCKEFKKLVDELRHLEGFKGSIVVSESEFIGTTSWREEQLLIPVIYSNEKEFVEQHQNIFDIIWKKSKPYAQRITEIEEGTEPEVIETTDNPLYAQNKVFDLLNSANKEILIIFSTSNAFRRQARDGAVQKLTEIVTNRPWIETKILTPKDSEIERMVAELPISNLCVRFIEALSKVSILMVDRKYSLVAELKDDTKQLVTEAIGFVTYSNSAPTVLSYAAIFDSLWKQTEMYEQLQIHDRMQKEFINTAAHELRTPIQPILGITELVKKEIKDDRHKELLEVISRNAHRLKNLSEDILEASKIE
ncbi:MAG TPA: histidine kinase dimerization/phospho-acceptor domain-containing protein, partial [Candidatus Nitrosocosmicus sp.]|nr:histidine kinase dimerization/phospho-acceptor domain-containing protein [Candidatus Nitrosocosmicus sp.]